MRRGDGEGDTGGGGSIAIDVERSRGLSEDQGDGTSNRGVNLESSLLGGDGDVSGQVVEGGVSRNEELEGSNTDLSGGSSEGNSSGSSGGNGSSLRGDSYLIKNYNARK